MSDPTPAEIRDRLVEDWRHRAIRTTRGNQSRLGCIVISMLGQSARNPPMISNRSPRVIMPNGFVVVDMWLRGRSGFLATPLGHITEIRDNIRGLADEIKATDAERIAMMECLRMWITRDYRARSDFEGTKQ